MTGAGKLLKGMLNIPRRGSGVVLAWLGMRDVLLRIMFCMLGMAWSWLGDAADKCWAEGWVGVGMHGGPPQIGGDGVLLMG